MRGFLLRCAISLALENTQIAIIVNDFSSKNAQNL